MDSLCFQFVLKCGSEGIGLYLIDLLKPPHFGALTRHRERYIRKDFWQTVFHAETEDPCPLQELVLNVHQIKLELGGLWCLLTVVFF